MKVIKVIFVFILLNCLHGYSQTIQEQFRVWRLLGYNGEVRLRGTYREFEVSRKNLGLSSQQDYYFNGLLHLNTKSYILHPNFMLLNLSGTYNPIGRKDRYLGMPEYSENYRTQGFDANALMFSKKRINITAAVSMNNSIQNVENITRMETMNKQYGAGLTYRNSVFPLSIAVSKQNIEQTDLNTSKKFSFEQKLFQASGSASITKYDTHYLSYLHTDNTGTDNVSIFNSQPFGTVNNVDQIELNDEFAFDSLKKYTFTSSILNSIERGSVYYRRVYARENLMLKLPKSFAFTANYNLGISELDSNKVSYQGIQTSLGHQLFESLYSKILYEHNQTHQTTYDDERNKYGCEFRYVKKIPTGKLSLGYSYFREFQKVKSAPTLFRVAREEKVLDDNQIVYLNNANIDLSTVLVRDVTGAIVYTLNSDYLLMQTNSYVEIIRIPGGLIANGSTVFVDYTCARPGQYGYYMDNYTFSADLLLFGSKLDLYYRSGSQNYTIQERADNLALNYYNRYTLGARLDFYVVKGGVEYEYYYSSILPHKSINYFLEFQQTFKKLSFSLNANMQTIKMTSEEGNRQDIDISTKLAYYLFKKTKLDLDYMYRSIKGRGVDLELTTARLEVTTELHRLLLSLGGEFYQNTESDSRLRFKGVYIQLTRNF